MDLATPSKTNCVCVYETLNKVLQRIFTVLRTPCGTLQVIYVRKIKNKYKSFKVSHFIFEKFLNNCIVLLQGKLKIFSKHTNFLRTIAHRKLEQNGELKCAWINFLTFFFNKLPCSQPCHIPRNNAHIFAWIDYNWKQ